MRIAVPGVASVLALLLTTVTGGGQERTGLMADLIAAPGVGGFGQASTSLTSAPPKGRRPASISNSTRPNAQMSARVSADLPRTCSGAMYAAVPRSTPNSVPRAVSVGEFVASPDAGGSECSAFARPKSRI